VEFKTSAALDILKRNLISVLIKNLINMCSSEICKKKKHKHICEWGHPFAWRNLLRKNTSIYWISQCCTVVASNCRYVRTCWAAGRWDPGARRLSARCGWWAWLQLARDGIHVWLFLTCSPGACCVASKKSRTNLASRGNVVDEPAQPAMDAAATRQRSTRMRRSGGTGAAPRQP
jgi:hypothetical protein